MATLGMTWNQFSLILLLQILPNLLISLLQIDPGVFGTGRSSMGPFGLSWYSVPPSASVPFWFLVAGLNGTAIEAMVLRDRGLLDWVIPTLLKVSKLTALNECHHTWNAYFAGVSKGLSS